MLAKINDKSDNNIEKQIHPISVQITELSSKQSENIQNEELTVTFGHPYYEYNFERKFQAKLSLYNPFLNNQKNNW